MKKAILFGIDYEGTPYELRGCSQDVVNVRSLISGKFQTELYTDDKAVANVAGLPIKANILTAMGSLTSGVSQFIIHYSGHGAYTRDLTGDELDAKDEYICPLDNSAILDDDLNTQCFARLPSNCKGLVLMDCCHSGTICDLRYRLGAGMENANDKSVADIVAISGCMDTQTSADAFIDGKYQGAMTEAFLYSLRSTKGGQVTVKQFINVMRAYLAGNGYRQVPQVTYTKRYAPTQMMSFYLG